MSTLTIHKQGLTETGKTVFKIPKGAWWLSIQLQHGVPVLWYKCDPEAPLEDFTVVGLVTGARFHDSHKLEFISTIQYVDGDFVVHYFKVQEE